MFAILPTLTVRYLRLRIRISSTMLFSCRTSKKSLRIKRSTQKVLRFSTRIRIHSKESGCMRPMEARPLLSRILRQNLWHRWRWMISMPYLICAPITLLMRSKEVFRHWQRLSSPWHQTADAMESVTSVHWPCTRDVSYSAVARSRLSKKRKPWLKTGTSKVTSTTLAARLQSFADRPATSRWR